MPDHLCLTITFLDPRFHGRRDGGEPEWPPSPLRLYQAIVAAGAAPTGHVDNGLAEALRWFEQLSPPRIVAPAHRTGEPYRLSVPNNAMDLVVKAWAKGNYDGSGDTNPATHRTMKTVRPTHLVEGDQVHYIWTLPDPLPHEDRRHAEVIRTAVRGIVALGWGIDLVVGHGKFISMDATDESVDPPGEQWEPKSQLGGTPLRAPKPGTFDALIRRHRAFLNRVTDNGFVPVPPLTSFAIVGYRRANDLPPRPFTAFALHPINGGDNFAAISRDRAVHVAAMLRHAACDAAKDDLDEEGWRTEEWGRRFVAGHGQDKSNNRRAREDNYPRFSYLPLPTIDPRGVASNIRRVIIAEPFGGDGRSIEWAINRLAGSPLYKEPPRASWAELLQSSEQSAIGDVGQARQAAVKYLSGLHPCQLPSTRDLKRWLYHQPRPHGEYRAIWSHVKKMCAKIEAIQPATQPRNTRDAVALLEPLMPDYVVRRYVDTCDMWTSVTPVIMPRYVACTELENVDALLRQCLQDAGLPFNERDVVIESRPTSWIAGAPTGVQFERPTYLRNLPAVHIRLCFRNAISGPIAIGAGRHCGLGLCVGM